MIARAEDSSRSLASEAFSSVFVRGSGKGFLGQEESDEISSLLLPSEPALGGRLARMALHGCYASAPKAARTAALRLIRTARRVKGDSVKRPSECLFNRKALELDAKGFQRALPKSRRVCLSYDIDQGICHKSMPSFADALSRRGLKATFNILTSWEYKPDWKMVSSIRDAGFEIGLHGGAHDTALGYRPKGAIVRALKAAIDKLPFHVAGYRAPALCMTASLMEAVAELGFRYDSSLPMSLPRCKCVESCFPYKFPSGLWELPPSLQDSTLFLDLGMGEYAALKEATAVIEEILGMGGAAILILHPYVLAGRESFHTGLLDWISSNSCECATMKELVDGLANPA